MACGSCGKTSPQSQYQITWGDGTTQIVQTISEARITVARQSDPVKQRRAAYRAVAKAK